MAEGETWRAVEIREDGSRRVLLEGIPAVDRHEVAGFCGWLGEVNGRVRVEREGERP